MRCALRPPKQLTAPLNRFKTIAKLLRHRVSCQNVSLEAVKTHSNAKAWFQFLFDIVEHEKTSVLLNSSAPHSSRELLICQSARWVVVPENNRLYPIHSDQDQVQVSVFVNIAEVSQCPKYRSITGANLTIDRQLKHWVEGLQKANSLLAFVRNAFQFILGTAFGPLRFLIQDRELIGFRWFLSVGNDELPHKMIQCRSQIVKNFPCSNRPFNRHLGCRAAIKPRLLAHISVNLKDNQSLDVQTKLININAERTNLTTRPINLCIDSAEIDHASVSDIDSQ